MEAVYQGRVYQFPSGHREKMEDSCAKHILTAFSPRGMVSLEYGDEKREDEIGAKGRDINRQFKIKQIETYNQTNEARKMQGASFLTPPPQVRKYAEELGIALNQPYVVKDKDREAMSALEKENNELKERLSKMEGMMQQILDGQKAKGK
jgi:hypothetical protein